MEDFFDMDWDEETDTVTRLFYTSRLMIKSFKKHGQFVVMDATCKTNRFNMPLVLLVGVDDTKATAIFGMGLILAEDIVSYIWILQAFKRAVGTTIIAFTSPHLCCTQSLCDECLVNSQWMFGDSVLYLQ